VLLEETKRTIKKMQKVTAGHFVVQKLENPQILCTPSSAAKLEKKVCKLRM
jgi:hypothetical protein